MTGLHAALAALVDTSEVWVHEPDGLSHGPFLDVEDVRALLAEHEPTPSDQALRDLRAGIEALAAEWEATRDLLRRRSRADGQWSGDKMDRREANTWDVAAERVRALLASSAPATASEGECASCGEGDPKGECPKSQRPCGHHCNHIWESDQCDWCGHEVEADDEAPCPWIDRPECEDECMCLPEPAAGVTSSDGDRGLSDDGAPD